MESSLSNIVNNISEGIRELDVIMDAMIKNMKLAELNINIAIAFLSTHTLKMI